MVPRLTTPRHRLLFAKITSKKRLTAVNVLASLRAEISLSGFVVIFSLSSCSRQPICCWWTTTSARSWMESKKVRLSVKCSTLFWSFRQVPRKITLFYALTSSIEYSIAESKNDILEPACFCSGRKHGFQEMVLTLVDGMDGIDFQKWLGSNIWFLMVGLINGSAEFA